MKHIIYIAALLVAITVSSCNGGAEQTGKARTPQTQSEMGKDLKSSGNGSIGADSISQHELPFQNGSPIVRDWDKKIIKTANLTLELKDFTTFNSTIHQAMKGFEAYIAQEEQTQSNEQITNNIVIKVPVAQFENLVNSFNNRDAKLLEKRITSEDVTTEVVDAKGRVETKKQVRERYLSLLKQAKNMKEILEVENVINGVTETIESASGRVNYLQHQSSYSTVNLKYFQVLETVSQPVNEQDGFFKKAASGFKNGGEFLGQVFLFLISIWPFLLAFSVVFIFIKRKKAKAIETKQKP